MKTLLSRYLIAVMLIGALGIGLWASGVGCSASVAQSQISAASDHAPVQVRFMARKPVVKLSPKAVRAVKPVQKQIPQPTKQASKPTTASQTQVASEFRVQRKKSGQSRATAFDLFGQKLRAKIEKQKWYPRLSQQRGHKGDVTVGFTLLRNGEFRDIRVHQGSPHYKLNMAAVKAVAAVGNFPIPSDVDMDEIPFLVTLSFQRSGS